MLLAGHGVGVSEFDFYSEYESFPEMLCPECLPPYEDIPTLTTYGMIALVVLLLIAGATFWFRRRRSAEA